MRKVTDATLCYLLDFTDFKGMKKKLVDLGEHGNQLNKHEKKRDITITISWKP